METNTTQNQDYKTIVLGGGCFWCTEAIFRETKGIIDVQSGFSGGHIKNPPYREVCTGITGHAEVIKITYNPKKVDLIDIITIHLLTHNPTTLNQQGSDKGDQYRSVIFYSNEEEKHIINEVINTLQDYYDKPIVTEVKAFNKFYLAEEIHQNYYLDNPDAFYCQAVITPKLNKFRDLFPKFSINN